MAMDLLNSGIGDEGRLKFILECIAKNKPLYKTDIIFLESMNNKLEHKIKILTKDDTKQEVYPKTLVSNEELDDIIDKKNVKNTEKITPLRKKRSLFERIFSR
jgi:uncharacterized UBP type Zn finger protein